MTVLIMSFLVGGFLLFSYLVGLGLLWLFSYGKDKKLKAVNVNPYIAAHKFKLQNDANYEAYIQWMHDNRVGDAPFDKEKLGNEHQVDESINDLLKK